MVKRGILMVVDVSVCSVKDIFGGFALSDAGIILILIWSLLRYYSLHRVARFLHGCLDISCPRLRFVVCVCVRVG